MEAASLNEDGRRRKLVVTGCLAQRYSSQLAADLPEADLVVGFQSYGNLAASLQKSMGMEVTPEALAIAEASAAAGAAAADGSSAAVAAPAAPAAAGAAAARVQVGAATVPFRPEWNRHRLTPKHSAYLRVAEGCNHACTFCAIPGFRCVYVCVCVCVCARAGLGRGHRRGRGAGRGRVTGAARQGKQLGMGPQVEPAGVTARCVGSCLGTRGIVEKGTGRGRGYEVLCRTCGALLQRGKHPCQWALTVCTAPSCRAHQPPCRPASSSAPPPRPLIPVT